MNKIFEGDFNISFSHPCNGYKVDVIREGNTVEIWSGNTLVKEITTESPTISQMAIIREIKKTMET